MTYAYRRPAIVSEGGSIHEEPRRHLRWVLVLNSYQRDNLLGLLNAVGYPGGVGGVEPFTVANNGDWVGEIALMLADPEREGVEGLDAEATGRPNASRAQLERAVAAWLKRRLDAPEAASEAPSP